MAEQRNEGRRNNEQQGGSALDELKTSLTSGPAVDRLKEAAAGYAAAQAQRLVTATGRKLGETTNLLNDIAEGRSPGLSKLAKESGRKFAEGKGPLRSTLEAGAGSLKDRAKEALQNIGGGERTGGGTGKCVTIIEQTDVGVPVREAYNQWTQFQEFSTFAKGVQDVEPEDDTSSDWRTKIFLSNRSWRAHTTEQIPDERIAWTSEGAKGSTKGVVTFHALTGNLTRVLLVIEYYPRGLVEKTGNLWRAQGRRARLDLKHFRRFVTMRGEATGEWRGEIRGGEVVRTHEEAIGEPAGEADEDEPAGPPDEEPEDDEAPAPEDDEAEDEPHEDEPFEDEDEDEGRYEDEADGPEDDVEEDAEENAEEGEDDEEAYEAERQPEGAR